MFGKRGDGYLVKQIDPVVGLMPYLMPMRCDAQVMLTYKIDYEKLARFMAEKGRDGYRITFMELFIAAYVRTISQLPHLNRFVINKRYYTRKDIVCSFAVLQDTPDGSVKENVAKCKFDPHDTIFDVAVRIKEAIQETRKADADNSTMKVANLLKRPLIANFIVSMARVLDRYGLPPQTSWTPAPSIPGCSSATTRPSACRRCSTTSIILVPPRCLWSSATSSARWRLTAMVSQCASASCLPVSPRMSASAPGWSTASSCACTSTCSITRRNWKCRRRMSILMRAMSSACRR